MTDIKKDGMLELHTIILNACRRLEQEYVQYNIGCEILKTPSIEDYKMMQLCAISTMGKDTPTKDMSPELFNTYLTSEHSPLYTLQYIVKFTNLPYCVSVHFVRHHEGVVHFVQSQRNDRQNNYDRHAATQDTPVTHIMCLNPMAITQISHARLCNKAADLTRLAWMKLVLTLYDQDKYCSVLSSHCVPNCIYRNGVCKESSCCHKMNLTSNSNQLINYNNLL